MLFLKKTRVFVFCLFTMGWFGINYTASAQWDVNKYLANTTNAAELQLIRDQISFLDNNNMSSPRLREVELRLRTNSIVAAPDDFRFRVAPLNPLERRANRDHLTVLREQLGSQQLVDFSQVMASRYYMLVNYWYTANFSRSQTEIADRYKFLIATAAASNDAGKELIRLEKRLFMTELKQLEAKATTQELIFGIKSSYTFSGEPDISMFQMVTVPQVLQHINSLKSEFADNIFLANEANKVKLSNAEWEIKRQESFSNIGFLQAEYRANDNRTFSEVLGVQLGIKLPLVNKDRPDLGRRKLELFEDQQKLETETVAMDIRQFNLENDLRLRIDQYNLIASKLDKFTAIESEAVPDIETLLELEDYKTDLQDRQHELRRDILISYIKWLHYQGQLSQAPYVNFLSSGREALPVE
jgi:hypothetical protein